MPFHVCQDEIVAFMMAVPFVSYALTWLRAKISRKPKCCPEGHGRRP